MKQYSLFFSLLSLLTFGVISCNSSSSKDNDPQPQTIVTSDSSDATGRLYVITYNSAGTSKYSGAVVKLFLTYDDLKHNLPLYTINSDNSGNADFGYVLKGNYYVTGSYSGNFYHDTTVAQVLPQKSITRYLYLR
jgi:hypothetical protein